MNYLKKCLISALESTIYYSDSYDVGKIFGEVIRKLESGKVEGVSSEDFLKGVQDGIKYNKNIRSKIKIHERD
jgi:hypothetical protein